MAIVRYFHAFVMGNFALHREGKKALNSFRIKTT